MTRLPGGHRVGGRCVHHVAADVGALMRQDTLFLIK